MSRIRTVQTLWRDYVGLAEPENHPEFVSKLEKACHKGMFAAGLLGLVGGLVYLVANLIVIRRHPIFFSLGPISETDVILWDKLFIITISCVAILLSRSGTDVRVNRLYMSFAGLAATFVSIIDSTVNGNLTSAHAYPALFMIAVVGTIPFRPLQAFSLSIILAFVVILSEIFVPKVLGFDNLGLVQSHVVYLIILAAMITGISIVTYRRTWEQFRLESTIRSQKTLREKRSKRLRELEHVKSRFFANISHEFRTPIALIVASMEDTISGAFGVTTKKVREENLRSLGHAQRLLRLVEQMLALSRVESGHLKIQPQAVEVNSFIADLVYSFTTLADRKGLKLKYDGLDEPLWAMIDPDLVETVLSNLLSNALKYTQEGRVHVSADVDALEPEQLRLIVRDDGPGISAEDQERVFDRLYRAEQTFSEQDGTGIGLSVVKEFVEAMNGTVFVSSTLGYGSVFAVSLPLVRTERLHTESLDRISNSGKWRYLEIAEIESSIPVDYTVEKSAPTDAQLVAVVDDNPEIRDLIRRRLGGTYRIVEAGNGDEALSLFESTVPDLIISDVMMPQMDGLELLTRLKESARLSNIPVIMLTADSSPETAKQVYDTGAITHLVKPFNHSSLLQIVSSVFTARSRNSEINRVKLEPVVGELRSMDDVFVDRITNVVRLNYADSGFTVERFADEMGMDKRTLQRHMKRICGYSPSVLVKEYRMKRAKQLLLAKASTVSEVAHAVGFSSASHFSTEFAKTFGNPPSSVLG